MLLCETRHKYLTMTLIIENHILIPFIVAGILFQTKATEAKR